MPRIRLLSLFSVLLMLFMVSAAGSQTREVSKDVKSKLFKQVLDADRELRECVAQDEGGVSAAEEAATVEEVDLNGDGVPEYEVTPAGSCACGMVNCSIYIFR